MIITEIKNNVSVFWRNFFFFFDCILTTENLFCLFCLFFYKNTQEKIENLSQILWKMSNIRSTQINDNHNDELMDAVVSLTGFFF